MFSNYFITCIYDSMLNPIYLRAPRLRHKRNSFKTPRFLLQSIIHAYMRMTLKVDVIFPNNDRYRRIKVTTAGRGGHLPRYRSGAPAPARKIELRSRSHFQKGAALPLPSKKSSAQLAAPLLFQLFRLSDCIFLLWCNYYSLEY